MSSQVILFACSKCFSRHPFEELSPGQQLCKVRHPFYFLSFIYEIASQLDYVRAMLRQLNRNAMNQIDRMRAVSFVAFSMVMRPKMNLHHSLHDYVTTRHTLGHIVFFFFLSGLSLFILSLLCYSNSENAQCAMLFSPSTMIQMRFINKPERRETFQTFCICRRVSHSEPICRDTERPTDRLPSFALLNCVHTIKFVCLPLTLTYFRQLIFFNIFLCVTIFRESQHAFTFLNVSNWQIDTKYLMQSWMKTDSCSFWTRQNTSKYTILLDTVPTAMLSADVDIFIIVILRRKIRFCSAYASRRSMRFPLGSVILCNAALD